MLAKVFDDLTGVTFVCKELGLTEKGDYERVLKWKQRGVVPSNFRGQFLAMCVKYKVEVTLKQLAGEEGWRSE